MTQTTKTAEKTVNQRTDEMRQEYATMWAHETVTAMGVTSKDSWDAAYKAAADHFDKWLDDYDAMRDEGAAWAARDAAGA